MYVCSGNAPEQRGQLAISAGEWERSGSEGHRIAHTCFPKVKARK